MSTNVITRLLPYRIGYLLIVASLHFLGEELLDWAIYIGPKKWGKYRVALNGDKLLEERVHTFFPSLPIEKYRR